MRPPLPAPVLIAIKDLRQRLRDRSALVVAVVAPLVIAGLMSVAFKGTEHFHFTLAVVDDDHGAVAAAVRTVLHDPQLAKVITVRPFATEAEAKAAIRSRRAQAGLVIPAGFTAAAAGAEPLPLVVLTDVNASTAANVTTSIASGFVDDLNATRLSVATAMAAGAPASELASLVTRAGALRLPEQVVRRPVGARELKAISYFSPAMAIFFLFFIVPFTARSFFVDREQGMIERIRVAPVRPVEILLGKALSVFVFGLLSLGTVAAVTSIGFGAYWGPPAAVAAVCAAMVVAVVALTALVIGLARSQRQAEGISSAIVFGLALVGGNFAFGATQPDLMRRMSLLTPNGWALRAFTDLSTTGGGMHTAGPAVAAILAFSAVVGTVAALLARRAVTA